MAERKWTQSQLDAINSREGTILVSAAAGSGKTAVLVQRVVDRITDLNNPCDADKLLIVTFTKAAALEMKNRISQMISELIESDPYNVHLRRQQVLLTKTHISTIHSFCSEVIRENFYKLNISKDFRIADANEMTVLRDEAVQCVISELYENGNDEFFNFVEAFSTAKDDSKLINIINLLYDFVRSHPFPGLWLDEKAKMYNEKENILNTIWGRTILEYTRDALEYCISLTQNTLDLIKENDVIEKAYKESFLSDMVNLNDLKLAIESKNWNYISRKIVLFEFAKLKPLRGYKDDSVKIKVCNNRDEVKLTIKKIAKLFYADENRCIEDLSQLFPIVKILFTAVKMFSKKLDDLKLSKNVADFGDLEHLMIKLLVNIDNDGKYIKTENAVILSQKFEEIMVDEYQDTNEAQDIIFRALSNKETNLFFVGDVKQSIYRFRQAMPEIFLKRKEKYPKFDSNIKNYPAKIILDRNFRSRSGITDSVNFIFKQIMSKQVGQIDYNSEEMLTSAALYQKKNDASTRIDLIDISKSNIEDMDIIEARYISKIIMEMISCEYKIKDGDVERPITYKDFCILIRSANKHASVYANELQMNSIPAWSDVSGNFFETKEISVILSLLRVIDNPIHDVSVLSVLFSPIFGFTPDKLSEIRVVNKKMPLYFIIKKLADNGDKQCSEFINQMEDYRNLATVIPANKLINYIYEKSGYFSMVQAMKNGKVRMANLRILMEYARNYEASGHKGLSGFIKFIDRLKQKGTDLIPANTVNENANVVRIMSIHRSKGLEFPVCIIAGCSRKFNTDRSDILLHPSLGLGIKLRSHNNMVQSTTMSREAVAIKVENDSISEELRILYVAMTRAKEKLILINSVKCIDKTLKKISAKLTNPDLISPYTVKNCTSFSDWILSCALKHPDGSKLREISGCIPGIIANDNNKWDINLIYDNFDYNISSEYKDKESIGYDNEILEKMVKRFNFVYHRESLNKIPSKVSASILVSDKKLHNSLKRPDFIKSEGLNLRERGIAIHKFMQFADYKSAQLDAKKETERLFENGFISREEKDSIDIRKINNFFASDLGKRILLSNKIIREYRFTVDISVERIKDYIGESECNEDLILQGAVDCIFEQGDEIVIVDYKTGLSKNNEIRKKNLKQLELYKYAIEKCFDKKVKECIIYSFF